MLKHLLQITLRTFRRYKSTFVINLVGLSAGLACALLIFLWVSDERSFDGFHKNDKRLYQIMVNQKQGDKIITSEETNGVMGELLPKKIPDIENAVSIAPPNWFMKFNITYGNNTFGAAGDFVGQDYFNVFSYPLLEGNKNSVLAGRYSIVLSRTLATKIFGTTSNVVGKTIKWNWLTVNKQCTVTGIYEDFPYNSTYRFDFVLPLDLWKDVVPPGKGNGPTTGPFKTFVALKEHTSPEGFEKKLASVVATQFDPSPKDAFFLQKYSAAYLHGRYENGVQSGGRIEYVRLFSIIAAFIILIACINFMNLSTAKAAARMKEVGLKKALGASRRMLIVQFLTESVAMSLLSLVIALLIVTLFLPTFNEITDKHLMLGMIAGHLGSILLLAVITGLISGSYPALYLSRFQPAITLKGKFAPLSGLQELWIRKGLVVFQFTLSVIFILSVAVIYNQINFIQKKDPGYDRENIIYFEMEGGVKNNLEPFLAGLRRVPGVVQASSIIQSIVLPTYTPSAGVTWNGENTDDRIRFYKMFINYDLIETLGIKMAAGRSFSRDFGADSTAIVLNEAAVTAMGLSNPIGMTIKVGGGDRHIVGVTKNFHFNSLHEQIRPFIFLLEAQNTFLVMVRLAKGGEGIKNIQSYYKGVNPGYTLDYKFLEDDYKKQYASEKLVGTLSKYFTGLAMLLSCLGLFGLATFAVERRTDEIWIRKVLGASSLSIIHLLSADFTRIVLLSILIGLPLSYWLTNHWLQSFAYRIPLGASYFLLTAFGVLLTAWLTIGIRIISEAIAFRPSSR
ncbi:MAG: ABC transporter permease [Bacteroidetes bacterium]|nr:ABC transporter permease [Bacteroidota bacterium]